MEGLSQCSAVVQHAVMLPLVLLQRFGPYVGGPVVEMLTTAFMCSNVQHFPPEFKTCIKN